MPSVLDLTSGSSSNSEASTSVLVENPEEMFSCYWKVNGKETNDCIDV